MLGSIWGSIKALGSIAGAVGKFFKWKNDRALMDAGAAKEREEAKDEALESIRRATDARRNVTDRVRKFDRNPDDK